MLPSLEHLTLLCAPPVLAAGKAPLPNDFVGAAQTTRARGRLEVLRIMVSQLLAASSTWPSLSQVFWVERWVRDGLGRERVEVRYGVTRGM